MFMYKNEKTGSLLSVPGTQKISEIDDWAYITKMMIYNDERLIKNNMQKLVNCLQQVKVRR